MSVIVHTTKCVLELSGDEVLPIVGRAQWIAQHGPLPKSFQVEVEASLVAWEAANALIRSDGSVDFDDKVVRRILLNLLCDEIRRTGVIQSHIGTEEGDRWLDRARFGAACEFSTLPEDSFPKKGGEWSRKTTPWFQPDDQRVPWTWDPPKKNGSYLLRLIYERGAENAPRLVRVDGPYRSSESGSLPVLPDEKYGRILVRVAVAG